MPVYSIYGRLVQSDIELPAVSSPAERAEILVMNGRVPVPERALAQPSCAWSEGDAMGLHMSGVGSFLVESGRRITYQPAPGHAPGLLRDFILGPAFAALLRQSGQQVLHGSAVGAKHRAALFLGHAGAGKSTLAAALVARGLHLVTDDVAAVGLQGGRALAYPGCPTLRLAPDVAALLRVHGRRAHGVHRDSDKTLVRLREGFAVEPVTLTHIYVLSIGDATRIEPMGLSGALPALMQHLYCRPSRRGTALADDFRDCAALVECTRISSLVRQSDPGMLDGLAEAVADDFAAS